jgi:hypothetical protein
MRQSLTALLALTVIFGSPCAFADVLSFHTVLSGTKEKVPNDTAATGQASVELDTASQIATYRIEFTGLSSPTTKVHFHGLKMPGMTAPEVIMMHVHATSPVTGSVHLTNQQILELKHGDWYANVHTEKYPDGEIRGWLVATP